MIQQLRNPKFYSMLIIDAFLFAVAYYGAYLLRFEFTLPPNHLPLINALVPWVVGMKLGVFCLFGLYRGMWRFSGLEDFWRLGQASVLSMLLIVATVAYTDNFTGYPRSVFLLDCVLTFLLTGGLRVCIRSYYIARNTPRGIRAFSLPRLNYVEKERKQILIIGAGGSGEKMLREIFDNPQLHYHVVGFLDDDPGKRGRTVHGVRVLGPADHLSRVLEQNNIEQVFISVPSATGAQMRRLIDICKGCGISYKTLPAIGSIMNGNVSIKSLRDVNYEDLLRRPPVSLETDAISGYLTNRTVMVTGAGGSIGSELCRQVAQFKPQLLILVDASESNLFHMQMELQHEREFRNYQCILGQVQQRLLMESVFRKYRPDVVFHAAAYKHVPMLERNPWEAVFNNVRGSQVMMKLSKDYGVKRFVLVSTDKAVRPTNVMGTSKRLTELILQSFQGNGTKYMAVRFGNVVGSSGSVIPLFRRQIEQGGPVTVTHPEVTRYFMTIPEAAQLILQAGALGEGGEIFILEMGTPVKIADMAQDLIRLSGKQPGRDIEIQFTGLREGEKLYEELITLDEGIVNTRHEKILVLRPNGNGNGNGHHAGNHDAFRQWLDRELEELCAIARKHDSYAIKRKLKQLVPEYTPQDAECVL
ncbi:polysaccharide biosynthesis protein [Syntrophobacter fumaroxidans]|uniref:Polysaccharide biosynthesis protein CapD n=1 Tax=Syntrophobacter fumaroxidans (strain DSM 10017 / MPOB) TaxID=335543 RepID=A0LNN1_SYNFM|nr:nucleoside-diphosphate sugar epimerase/dehydratase [Syntrophobacter fumaroxidans]ABK19033.1 polysaccharide biosynthesis protein CapD [Syntrophobacter fumaroxidans MPOB]